METDEVFVLNGIPPELEKRTNKSGRDRFTIRMQSEPLVVDTRARSLLAPVVAAAVNHLRERVLGITAPASPGTIRARKTEARAYAEGKPWAVRRYNGGKTGATPPVDSDRALNASGRLGNSIRAAVSGRGTFRVDVAANRLDASTGNIERIWNAIKRHVPEIADVSKLMEANDIVRARYEAAKNMIRKLPPTTKPTTAADLARVAFETLQQLGNIIETLAG